MLKLVKSPHADTSCIDRTLTERPRHRRRNTDTGRQPAEIQGCPLTKNCWRESGSSTKGSKPCDGPNARR